MTYEEQLSAAKHRAERDQARQEAKGLREELETAEAEHRRHRANLDARYKKKADESRRRGQAMHGMSRLIRERNEEIKALKERIADMEPRLMPDGCEWPRYDTGEPVPLGGEVKVTVHDEDGDFDRTLAIRSIEYKEDGVLLEGTKNEMVILSHGERVKRPAPKVLDAEGVEIRVGDTVWHVHDLDKFTVTNPNNEENLSVSCMGEDGKEYCCYPNGLTHRAPVIAADGRPLREGETVYLTDSTTAFIVDDIMTREDGATVVHLEGGAWNLPQYLTHERPDSWERLEEDANAATCVYFGVSDKNCGGCGHYSWDCAYDKARDLVLRAKALAERGE